MKKKTESGRSMIEMVGVLAVMGLITAGAFVLISSGLQSQKRSSVTDEIDVIAANVRSLGAQATDRTTPYTTLPANCAGTGTGVADAKSLAEALLGSSVSAYGTGTYYSVCQTDNAAHFAVALNGLTKSECKTLAARAYSNGTAVCTPGTANNNSYVTVTFKQ